MKRAILSAVLPFAASLAVTAGLAPPAEGAERDKKFFQSIEGAWVGPGEIVAGKYKGTKFTCSFSGTTPSKKLGMTLDGGCRVGMFTQRMSATVEHSGSGLDIISGNVIEGRKVVLDINRNQLSGVMQARLPDDDTMTVTVSVRVDRAMVPVIGMNLKRVDASTVGAIAPN